jgi:two-component system CheB/CheR fusion protein
VATIKTSDAMTETVRLVGVGVTDRGIGALQRFLRGLPGAPRVAIVATGLEDCGPEAIARLAASTSVPVAVVTDRTDVRAGRVYVAPMIDGVTVVDGALRVEPGTRGSVDRLLRSLAHAQGADAIGVILAGDGVDGALGLSSIKERGGLVLAQDPGDAERDELPRTALATGLTDLIAPAGELPAKIASIVAAEERAAAHPERDDAAAETLREILSLVQTRTGYELGDRRRSFVLQRVLRRVHVGGFADLAAYVRALRTDPNEIAILARALLVRVTSFFGDRELYDALEHDLVPALLRGGDRLRIWVSGCGTGEDAYALAMLICERLERLDDPPRVQIFATELDKDALARARAGRYPHTISADVAPARIDRCFRREGASLVVRKQLREMILFSEHDALRDPPFSRLDLIISRNVIGALGRIAQDRMLGLFHFALRPDRYLVVGSGEFAETVPMLFARVDDRLPVYQRRPGPVPNPTAEPGSVMPRPTPYADLSKRAFECCAVPMLLVDGELELIHIGSGAERYLSAGDPAREPNVLRAIHPGLRLELWAAIQAVREAGRLGDSRIVRLELGGQLCAVQLTARVVQAFPGGPDLFRIAFDEIDHEPSHASYNFGDDPARRELEDELNQTRHRLQATILDYEATLHELRTANEQLHRFNEELHASTEELESSKEELQSLNEEFGTVNLDLQEKMSELARAHADLQNLMTAVDVAVIFLDRDLNISRYTPPAQELFRVIATDLGRPLSHLAHRLDLPDVNGLAREVLTTLRPIERDVASDDGRRFMARVHPYRNLDGEVAGVVLKFVDVTRVEEAREALRINEERFRLALRTAPVVMFAQDRDLRYTWGYMLGGSVDFVGKTDAELFPADEADKLIAIKRHVIETGIGQRAEMSLTIGGEVAHYDFNIEPLRERDRAIGVTCAAVDVTPSKRLEMALREADRRKDEFLATLAHELRNPLAPLRAALDLQELMPEDLGAMTRSRKIMDRQVQQLVRLVDDLLDVSRITQGKIQLRFHRCPIASLIDAAIEATSSQIDAAGHQVTVSVTPPDLELECDYARLTQVLTNLLSNAVKYTPRRGQIKVTATTEGELATVCVRDNGAGISAELLPHVFDLFTQADDAGTRSPGGLGIGLNLVAKLVDLHGGRVEARSEGAGRGSEFAIHVPISQEARAGLQPVSAASRARNATGAVRRVLVVDDNEDVTGTVSEVVRMIGHEVETAHSGPAALNIAEAFHPDVVLLDIGMPGMNGYEVARALRARPHGHEVMLVAVTGWGQPQDVATAKDAGFDHHVVKPAGLATLRELLGVRAR